MVSHTGRGAGTATSTWEKRATVNGPLLAQFLEEIVAEIAGHKRLETTCRYSLPSLEDHEAAMERLQIEY